MTSSSSNPDSTVSADKSLFDKRTLGAAIEEVWRIVKDDYLTAASAMREIKLKLVAHIVVAYEVAETNSLVSMIIDAARNKSGYPARNARVKHGDFGLFVRACLSGEMEKSLRKNSPVVTQLADDAYAVWKTYNRRDELVLGNEGKVADYIRETTYSSFHSSLKNLDTSSGGAKSSPSGKVKFATAFSDIVVEKKLAGKVIADVMTDLGAGADVFVVSQGSIARLVRPGTGGCSVAKAITCKGDLYGVLGKAFGSVS